MVYFLAIGFMEKRLHARKNFNVKLEKLEKCDEYITNVKPYIRPTKEDATNDIAAHVLTY